MAKTKVVRNIRSRALFWGLGNSGDYIQWGEAGKNAVEWRFNTLATSGDTRGIYARMKFSQAGSGEVARFFANVSYDGAASGGTINGAHISLSVDAACDISGAGNALRATLGAAAESRTLAGALSAIQVDSDIGTGNTLPTVHAFMRFTNTGAVAIGNLFQVPDAANGTMFAAHTTQTLTHSLKIIDTDGTAYYIMCTDAATNRS